VPEHRQGPGDRDVLQDMKKSQDELNRSGLLNGTLQKKRPGEESMGFGEPSLLPAEDRKSPEVDDLVLGAVEEESGAREKEVGLVGQAAQAQDGREDAVGDEDVSAAFLGVAGRGRLLDRDVGQALSESWLVGEGGPGGLSDVVEEDRAVERGSPGEGPRQVVLVEGQELFQEDLGLLDGVVELGKGGLDPLEDAVEGARWLGLFLGPGKQESKQEGGIGPRAGFSVLVAHSYRGKGYGGSARDSGVASKRHKIGSLDAARTQWWNSSTKGRYVRWRRRAEDHDRANAP